MFFLFPINCGAISFIPFVFIPQKSKEREKRRRKMGKTIIMSFFARHYRDVTKHQDNEDSALHPEILRSPALLKCTKHVKLREVETNT